MALESLTAPIINDNSSIMQQLRTHTAAHVWPSAAHGHGGPSAPAALLVRYTILFSFRPPIAAAAAGGACWQVAADKSLCELIISRILACQAGGQEARRGARAREASHAAADGARAGPSWLVMIFTHACPYTCRPCHVHLHRRTAVPVAKIRAHLIRALFLGR